MIAAQQIGGDVGINGDYNSYQARKSISPRRINFYPYWPGYGLVSAASRLARGVYIVRRRVGCLPTNLAIRPIPSPFDAFSSFGFCHAHLRASPAVRWYSSATRSGIAYEYLLGACAYRLPHDSVCATGFLQASRCRPCLKASASRRAPSSRDRRVPEGRYRYCGLKCGLLVCRISFKFHMFWSARQKTKYAVTMAADCHRRRARLKIHAAGASYYPGFFATWQAGFNSIPVLDGISDRTSLTGIPVRGRALSAGAGEPDPAA